MSKVYYYQFLPKYGCIKFSKTVFLRVMISNKLCPPVKVWLLCDPMMGWCIIRKQWLAPTSGSTVAHAAVCVSMVHIDALITSLIYTNPCNMILNTSWIQSRAQLVQNMTQRAANAQATKMMKITTRVPVAATAVRTGRGSVANLGDKPVAAPSQVEEADHLFSRLQPLTNYQ